jgi:hypothetical protein
MLAVLIIGYLRPDNIAKILEQLNRSHKVYIFIDYSMDRNTLNEQVLRVAQINKEKLNLQIYQAEKNFGVAKSVPAAIDWVLSREEAVVVFEDDCIPNDFAMIYFNNVKKLLSAEIVMISGRSPWNSGLFEPKSLVLSNFPLTNGWMIKSKSWSDFRKFQLKGDYFKSYVKGSLRNPNKLIPISFFTAASVLAKRNLIKSWDAEFAFFILLNNKFSVTPNFTCVEVLGVDAVASNSMLSAYEGSEIFVPASNTPPSTELNLEKYMTSKVNYQIMKKIYYMKWYHIFSPIKSMLIIIQNFIVRTH